MSFFGGFPFGGFGGAHQEDSDDEQSGEVDNTSFYTVLESQKTATQDQLKEKYKQLVKKYHPDRKGGNAQKFQQVKQAYQTLGDPDKRALYDKYGSKGSPSNQNDLLNMFFGGQGGRQAAQKKQMAKVKPTKKGLEITLQDIYNGKIIKVQHSRTRCCQPCKGKGGQGVQKCKTCKGKGIVIQMYQMGPGMYQQVQKHCDTCSGQGEIIAQGGKCKECNGKKIQQKSKIIQVPLDKGTPNNHPITLPGEGNQIPDALAGDLIFITQQQPHAVFTRKGADLYMKKDITLLQSLTGFEFVINHLDGHQFTIYSKKGEIIPDHKKKIVRGLGMPFFKDPMSHGNLIIQFHVVMPKRGTLTAEHIKQLATILPGKVNPRPANNEYEMLTDFQKQNVNTNEAGGHKQQEQQQQEQEGGQSCQAQ